MLPQLVVTIPEAGWVEPGAVFGAPKRAVWLEIGFGAGEHLAVQAQRHPDIGFLACEVFEPGIAGLLGHIECHHLDNIRIFAGDARLMIAAMRPSSIDRVFILFPDPWPKRRHENRRLVSRGILDALAVIMTDGAELHLATDDGNYLSWMLEQVTEHPLFEWLVRGPGDWRNRPKDWAPTRYEQKARAAGRAPSFLRLRRRFRR